LLDAIVELDKSLSGYKVTRLGHSLQAATRAWRAGADKDWVVAALLHDIGDIYAPYNYDEYAAAIIRPFVREQCSWVVEKHGDFQLLYYGQNIGANPNKRGMLIATTSILKTARSFAKNGINRVSTQTIPRSNFRCSPLW
jgi:predicted HD phosphohydrolase